MTTLSEDAATVRRLYLQRDKLKAAADEAERAFKAAQAALFERMDAEKVDGIKVDGIGFSPARTVYATVKDRAAFVAWAEVHNPELVQPRERKSLLNDEVRQALDDGRELPPGVSFYAREYVSQRAA
jgi:hypothetical protein